MENERRESEMAGAQARHGQREVRLPDRVEHIDQDTEYCSVLVDGVWQKIRFHDYDRIFAIPGLYEQLFHDILDCRSPDVVGKLLKEQLQRENVSPSSLRVLDLGAGNGLVGAQLRTVGAGHLVGVDIIPEARQAALRDRPEVYDDYLVVDMTRLAEQDQATLASRRFNALSCVAALGYGDIPPEAFRTAFNFVADGGWIAFTIKDRFLSEADTSGFARLIERATESGLLTVHQSERYRHRLDVRGEPLHYVALVGTKQADIPADLVS
ncbi:class I SAM-dependent DNA methyltransferase [Saccharomonospora xinjiangensis]|uniref:Methyltransferase family protein n=1 Tax=Saccharomonospora xinjiangensis XJ-54 TaxID=882086 RepID=I0V7U4_9PSEU|nr:class I SAM-dependent methyltransferase [Saccharomonospora xinjiangensis]EID56197.1 methyltransferase family protein [Saccharomonospora xinjiangensis XJ-54]